MTMFCPKCGQPMEMVDGTYKCISGDMPLSKVLHDRLSEVFVARSRSARALTINFGGRWFCPGCGSPASTDATHVRCEKCGEYLDEFLYQLIELHPHRDASGRWR
ncbi:MAG: hypothetical protein ACHREM_09220 [Polyangiales bacterium]